MPTTIEGWTGALTALAGLALTLWKLWQEYAAWRSDGKREALMAHLQRLAPLAVVALERIAAHTPTKKDDAALEWVKRGLAAAGYPLPADLEKHARELLHAEYQRYKVEALGVAAHIDGAAVKAALEAASAPPAAPGK